MAPRIRKFALTAHIVLSVGWLGAVIAYLALAIAGLKSEDPQMVRAAYLSMELIGWFIIVPLSLGALATGLIQSLGTEWGLIRHYWVAAKFGLTMIAVAILLVHMPRVTDMAAVARTTDLSSDDFRQERMQLLIHAAGGLVVLLINTILSVYKPWGRTRYAPAAGRTIPPRRIVIISGFIFLIILIIVFHRGGIPSH